ncbi:MAG: DUF2225 domain-containing protein [Phycisphaerales bacterium]
MTTVEKYSVPCGMCGSNVEMMRLMSCSQFGPTDLDYRPPSMARDTIGFRVHRCENCGFAGTSIGTAVEADRDVVKSERYQGQLRSDSPELSITCACAALLAEAAGNAQDAAWHWLEAAWVCDDKSQPAKATEFRIEAARCMEQVVAEASNDQELRINCSLLLIDLNRRAARFDQALLWCQSLQTAMDDVTIRRTVLLQLQLIEVQDIDAHPIPTEEHKGGA